MTKKLSKNKLLFIFIIVILFLRLIPFFIQVGPSGADTTMHTYITYMIQDTNGVPTTYKPILNSDSFGNYAAGFHIISALVSLFTGIESYRAVFFMGCFTFFLISLAYISFLSEFNIKLSVSVLLSFLASFLMLNPQLMSIWGGYPTVFSFIFMILSLSLIKPFYDSYVKKNKFDFFVLFLSLIFLISSFLSHLLIFATGSIIYAFVNLYFICDVLSKNLSRERTLHKNRKVIFDFFKKLITNYLVVCIFIIIILIPNLISFNITPSKSAEEYTVNWVRNIWSYSESITKMIPIVGNNAYFSKFVDIFSLLIYSFGAMPLIIILLIGLRGLDRKKYLLILSFIIPILILLIISRFELIHHFYLFYPERTALFLILSILLFSSKNFKINNMQIVWSLIILLFIIMSFFMYNNSDNLYFKVMEHKMPISEFLVKESIFGNYFVYAFGDEQYTLTKSDINAIKWLKENTNQTDVVKNNYYDAGLWIPAINFQPITRIHGNPAVEETQNNRSENYKYIFVGNKKNSRIDNTPINTSIYDFNSSFVLVFRDENASIYEVLR
jgi:hypothetical protein